MCILYTISKIVIQAHPSIDIYIYIYIYVYEYIYIQQEGRWREVRSKYMFGLRDAHLIEQN